MPSTHIFLDKLLLLGGSGMADQGSHQFIASVAGQTKLCVSLISLRFYCPMGALNHVCVLCTMGLFWLCIGIVVCLFVCSRVVWLYYTLAYDSKLYLQYSLWALHSLHYLKTKLCVSLISLHFYCPMEALNHVCVLCTMGWNWFFFFTIHPFKSIVS